MIDRNGIDVGLYARRLAALAVAGTALFVGFPDWQLAWLPALVGLFGWLGLLILAGYWMDRG